MTRHCNAGGARSFGAAVVLVLAVSLLVEPSVLVAAPSPDAIPVWDFNGATPGKTTSQQLLDSPRWGPPLKQRSDAQDVAFWEYRVNAFAVTVTIRESLVRSIDVVLPKGVLLEEVERAYELEDMLPDGEAPVAALVGTAVNPDWDPRAYGCGRLLVFVEQVDGKETAQLVRYYGPDETPVIDPGLIAVAHFAGWDELVADLRWWAGLSGDPSFPEKLARNLTETIVGHDGPPSFDPARPWVLLARADERDSTTINTHLFAPSRRFADLLRDSTHITGMGQAPATSRAADSATTQFFGIPLGFATPHEGEWAVFANGPPSQASIPSLPESLLQQLRQAHDFALRIYVGRIPVQLRTEAANQIRQGIEQSMAPQSGVEDAAERLQTASIQQVMNSIVELLSGVDQVALGASIGRDTGSLRIVSQMQVKPESKLAARLAAGAGLKDRFAGFRSPKETFCISFASAIAADDEKMMLALLEQFEAGLRNELLQMEGRPGQMANELLDQFAALLQETLRSGRYGLGAAFRYEPRAMSFAAGVEVKNSAQLEQSVRRFLSASDFAKDAALTMDAANVRNVTLHSLVIPLDNNHQAQQLFGKRAQLVFGFGEESLYLALGARPLAMLEEILERSPDAAPKTGGAMACSLHAPSLLRLLLDTGSPDTETRQVLEKALAAAGPWPGQSLVTLSSAQQGNVQIIELEIQQAPLAVLASIAAQMDPVPDF